jgi:catechol 2,3-dioxygenase-like lactoylglutathione lyase family enzyme
VRNAPRLEQDGASARFDLPDEGSGIFLQVGLDTSQLTDLPVRWKIVQGSSKKKATVSEAKPHSGSTFQSIRAIDYTVIFVRDMAAMRHFYEDMLGFPLLRELSQGWIEYRLGSNTLVLAKPSRTAADPPTPDGSASLQLAFKVSAAEVDQCAAELVRQGVSLLSPPTDQLFGHRTLFFRDPDGNLLEVFADI